MRYSVITIAAAIVSGEQIPPSMVGLMGIDGLDKNSVRQHPPKQRSLPCFE